MKKLFTICAVIYFSSLCFAADRPIITDLQAIPARGNKIILSWKNPENPEPKIQKLLVFKSRKAIGTYTDIQDAELVSSLSAANTTYSDTVKNYTDYYYAVIAQVNNGRYDIILPSVNATVNGAHLKLPAKKESAKKTESAKEKLVPINGKRETPLPFLDLTQSAEKKQIKMSDKAKESVASLSKNPDANKNKRMEPYVFEEDLISPDGGDDFILFEILRTTFIQKKYKESAEELSKLLGTNRSESVTKRAVFYLGESFYYTKDYENAVRTFLLVYDNYPMQAKKWIDATLEELNIKE